MHHYILCCAIEGAEVRKNKDDLTVSHRCTFCRILSTAGFITSPEGDTEVAQGIFIDTEVAQIV